MSDFALLSKYRVRSGAYASDDSLGFTGFFMVIGPKGEKLKVLASDEKASGWQHVSVSLADKPNTTPTWATMCWVKDLFWGREDVVVQFHPRASDYVNHHPGCLHLWRCIDGREFPTPPSIFVGPKVTGPDLPAASLSERGFCPAAESEVRAGKPLCG